MAYSDSKDGCIDFLLPAKSQQAIKDAWAYLKDKGPIDATEDGSAEWDHSTFSCMDNWKLCLAVCCCPAWGSCIAYRNAEYMTGDSCEVAFVSGMAAGAVCLGPCHMAVVRGNFRRKYGLKGSKCMDFWCGCCCGPLTLCSETNELMSKQGVKVPWLNLEAAGAGGGAKVAPSTKADPAE
ncbi:hypothetical protein HYH03_001541 [Edaphochlamys debaryana]|uniref:Uncharacterized protein n=1 Tax=Edaphochlamys debaryana TaxID=47281 RepID=A0A835YN62_9CHLO|nr:hypothetical protein HYH03_001541 [Edaphochlamys debaryana]|eukprot:KAG2500779.1 hypothetical protein HYH03_001541 [Edaphochlamys debaryana]